MKNLDHQYNDNAQDVARRVIDRVNTGAMISYAQNFEDVLLDRVFRDRKNGFFIDIGAFHPVYNSVTNHFYLNGWNGLNIDIDQDNINRFKTQRPRDINLCVAVGNNNETMKFFNLPGTPRTTILSNLANDYEKRGWRVNEKIVSVRTISSIIDHYEISEIDFLKIDVEGAEEIVLQGGDWKRHRPKIILVEATFPETDIENHFSWESILLSSDYKFAFFDGLNRYYVSAEQSELLHKINQPANFFDNFLRNDTFILAKAVSQNMSRRLD